MICAQTRVVDEASVARLSGLRRERQPWLRDPRLAEAGRDEVLAQFLSIEIEEAGGHRMSITDSYDPEALACLIRGVSM